MTQDEMKKNAALKALTYIEKNTIVGVGTGSTVNHFIDGLSSIKDDLIGVVSSSVESTKRLEAIGIEVFDLNSVNHIDVYVDGADEINQQMHMIKGGGAALTREKVVAAVANRFICIADESKQVDQLGHFPLPVEVIPMARSYVARQLVKLGGDPVYRQGVITDNGNVILDVHHLTITDAPAMENQINAIVGVVTNGLFATRAADVLVLGTTEGAKILK